MGATHQSVIGSAQRETDYNEVRLAASNDDEYRGLEYAFRLAVEAAVKNNNAVKAAVSTEVQRSIIDKYTAWKGTGKPWPFKLP